MSRPPNILLFLTDDHGAWATGAYGNREVRSPVLDRLAEEGVRFVNAFTPCPVCSPARACLMTGRTPSQVGIHDWLGEGVQEIGDRDWLAGEVTLPELLAAAGYHCGLSGKWHLGRSHLRPRGFDWHFGLQRWQGEHIQTYTYVHNNQPVTLTGNKTRLITDYALEFLRAAPADRPFFLNIGYIATHSPYADQEPDLEALYDHATFADIPPYVPHPWVRNEDDNRPVPFDAAGCRSRYRSYYAAVTDMDRNVSRILDYLRAAGQLDNTIVVYTADHGLTLGHHGFFGKGNSTRPLNMYDTCLRVPLILRHPNLPAGHVVEQCVDHYDLFQALCQWAGASLDTARAYPGRSLRPLADGRPIHDWSDTRFGEYGDLRMVRTPRAKLVRRYPDGPDDLFDLTADPEEMHNLATDPTHAALRTALLAELETWYAAHEDPAKSGLRVKQLPVHNRRAEAWRDGLREARGLQCY